MLPGRAKVAGVIRIEHAGKSFDRGRTWAVREVSLEVRTGEWLVLLGSSGSGKSTLLKMVNRLVAPSAGRVSVDGRDVAAQDPVALRRSMGYAFQGVGLFPHWTVEENVAAVPRLLGWAEGRRRERARELLHLMGMDPAIYAGRWPAQLSGGQRQRVGVARALAADPPCLLLDEPFGALDGVTRDALQGQMLGLKRTLGKTVVFVTHDLFEAMALADRIGVMHGGALEQVGPAAELLARPSTPFVRDLFAKPREQLARLAGQAEQRTKDP
jgi:osmoprotectant transport system ATP-binding protein